MLPQPNRLRSSSDLRLVMRRGRRLGSSHLVLHVLTRPEPSAPRAGFVVGKVVGNSVQRHRVIRQLRHAVAARIAGVPASTDLVVRALGGARDVDIAAELEILLERAGIHA